MGVGPQPGYTRRVGEHRHRSSARRARARQAVEEGGLALVLLLVGVSVAPLHVYVFSDLCGARRGKKSGRDARAAGMRLKEYRIPPARWESAKLEPTACPDSVIVPYKHPPAPRPALTSKRAAQRRGPEIEPCNGPLQRNRPPQERERLRRRGGEGTAVESSGKGSIVHRSPSRPGQSRNNDKT